jgi:diguanylate cyclase (GGDEF)-like protein
MMSQTVLMVDDSIPLHALVRTHLRPHAVQLKSAYDGESGLSMAAAIRPSLILLDVNLPKLDGFEVCRSLKANPATAEVPLVFLTANAIENAKAKGLGLGAVDYITKPFKGEDLQARVRRAMQAKQSTSLVDPGTGLWNRAYLNAHLPQQLLDADRLGRPLACVVSKVLALRSIRARHGETAANNVLRCVGEILRSHSRRDDIVCRLEGDLLAIVLNGANAASATRIAERLAADVRKLRSCGGIEMKVTCSFGVADSLAPEKLSLIDRAIAGAQRGKAIVGK